MESEDPKKQDEKGVDLLMTVAILLFAISITFIIALEFFITGSK